MPKVAWALTAGILLSLSTSSPAAEVIHRYHSDITVQENGALSVRETIQVRSENLQIKHGIYRDFPTTYKDRWGHSVKVGFRLEGVERDGRPEPWHTSMQLNGVRVYAGDKNSFVSSGDHTYVFRYATSRQLGFFEDHDELYWNVTGNGWSFPMESAAATLHLPAAIPPASVRLEAYTGRAGSKNQAFRSWSDGSLQWETTAPLAVQEGLTIVASWPTGFIRAPTSAEKWRDFFADNRAALIMLVGFLLTFGYYGTMWLWVGKDPAADSIVARYEPPPGLSAAAMRFIARMGYDHKSAAVAVLEAGVKGAAVINQTGSRFTIEKGKTALSSMAADSQALLGPLLAEAPLTLTNAEHSTVKKALDAFKTALKTRYEKNYFVTNSRFFVLALVLSLAAPVFAALTGPKDTLFILPFMAVWLTAWTFGVVGLVGSAAAAWKKALAGDGISYIPAVFVSLFSLPFLAGEAVGLYILSRALTVAGTVIFVFLAGLHVCFYQWLKAPTLMGRKLLDQIDGFKMYLAAVESDQLRRQTGPTKNPALYERYLPYAMALDVEDAWTGQFTAILAAAAAAGAATAPYWYHGSAWSSSSPGLFASALGSSLSSAISSSSVAPGSGSGGGGGGSSGGGGGGGGGGGW